MERKDEMDVDEAIDHLTERDREEYEYSCYSSMFQPAPEDETTSESDSDAPRAATKDAAKEKAAKSTALKPSIGKGKRTPNKKKKKKKTKKEKADEILKPKLGPKMGPRTPRRFRPRPIGLIVKDDVDVARSEPSAREHEDVPEGVLEHILERMSTDPETASSEMRDLPRRCALKKALADSMYNCARAAVYNEFSNRTKPYKRLDPVRARHFRMIKIPLDLEAMSVVFSDFLDEADSLDETEPKMWCSDYRISSKERELYFITSAIIKRAKHYMTAQIMKVDPLVGYNYFDPASPKRFGVELETNVYAPTAGNASSFVGGHTLDPMRTELVGTFRYNGLYRASHPRDSKKADRPEESE